MTVVSRKDLGQHWLAATDVLSKIVALAAVPPQTPIIEIGAGAGSLTRQLLQTGHPVIAIEPDQRFVPVGKELAELGDLRWIQADARQMDVSKLCAGKPAVVGNLPYYAATAMLQGWLRQIEQFVSLTLMFQREVAQRLVAGPNQRAYGRLSVLVAAVSQARICLELPPALFEPIPKVDSALVRFTPNRRCSPTSYRALEEITSVGFTHPQKKVAAKLHKAGIKISLVDPDLRARQIDPASWIRIAEDNKMA